MSIRKIRNVDDTYFDVFMSISEALTGFKIYDLQATGLAGIYYQYIGQSISQPTFIEFLNKSKEVFTQSRYVTDIAIKNSLLSDLEMKKMADKLITLWYNGTWEGVYLNDNSYKEGLIWKAIHSHPPGAKQPGFKSWSINPEKHSL